MFVKKATAQELTACFEKLKEAFGEVEKVEDAPAKQYMIKWLSAFAPDMTFADAKSFCLPRIMYRNYIWHAFSFEKTDSFVDDDAREAFKAGFEGRCYVLLNGENLLCAVPDGTVFNPENVSAFSNIVIFKEDFSETYVHTGSAEFGPYYKSADMNDAAPEDIDPDDYVVEEEEIEETEE